MMKQFKNSVIWVENCGTDTTPEFCIRRTERCGVLWMRESISLSLEEAEAVCEMLRAEIEKAKQKKEKLGV